MDPPQASLGNFQPFLPAVFDSIIQLTVDGQVAPGIAERWEIAQDGLTETFYVRKGVKFHDGSPLTGADVKFSIERMIQPDARNGDAVTWRSQVASVELRDDYTVVVHMKQPQFMLLTGLSSLSGVGAVMPKKYIEEKGASYFNQHPIGSGPYKVVSGQPGGNKIELEAVEGHWRATPRVQKITVIAVMEEATKVAMLKTGELDIAAVTPDSVATLKSAGLRVMGHEGTDQTMGWAMYDMERPDAAAISKQKVRQALSLAINREEMATKLFGGYAKPAALGNAVPAAYFWDENQLKPDPHDPEGAKKLLAEAGYANGFKTKLWDTGGANSTVTLAVAGYWQKIGVNAEITPIDFTVLQKMYAPKQTPEVFNSFVFLAYAPSSTSTNRMVTAYHSKGSVHNTNNPQLDQLLDKIALTADPTQNKQIALQAAVMAKNEYTFIGVLNLQAAIALGPKVGDMKLVRGVGSLGPGLETISLAR